MTRTDSISIKQEKSITSETLRANIEDSRSRDIAPIKASRSKDTTKIACKAIAYIALLIAGTAILLAASSVSLGIPLLGLLAKGSALKVAGFVVGGASTATGAWGATHLIKDKGYSDYRHDEGIKPINRKHDEEIVSQKAFDRYSIPRENDLIREFPLPRRGLSIKTTEQASKPQELTKEEQDFIRTVENELNEEKNASILSDGIEVDFDDLIFWEDSSRSEFTETKNCSSKKEPFGLVDGTVILPKLEADFSGV